MIFYGINNQKVEITIINYEVPPTSFCYNNVEHDGFDDWLEIKVNIISDFGNYDHISSIFLIYEIENLIYWLDKLSKNKQTKNNCVTTTEDYFEFVLLNRYNDKEKRFKIFFKEKKDSYVECLANNKRLRKYSKELLYELDFLFCTYKAIKTLFKKLIKVLKNIENDRIIAENHTVKIKENFKKGYRDEKGYKIIYSRNFLEDIKFIKNHEKENSIEAIFTQIEDIKLYPFKYTSKWSDYSLSHGICFKVIDKYIIFYIAWRYKSIKFIRIIKNNKYYSNYLNYDFRDLSLEE
jgi:hypothetical protein